MLVLSTLQLLLYSWLIYKDRWYLFRNHTQRFTKESDNPQDRIPQVNGGRWRGRDVVPFRTERQGPPEPDGLQQICPVGPRLGRHRDSCSAQGREGRSNLCSSPTSPWHKANSGAPGWVRQVSPTLGLGSGCDPRVLGLSPLVGALLSVESASPSLSASSPACALSLSNK